jgi:hypothetical protein
METKKPKIEVTFNDLVKALDEIERMQHIFDASMASKDSFGMRYYPDKFDPLRRELHARKARIGAYMLDFLADEPELLLRSTETYNSECNVELVDEA